MCYDETVQGNLGEQKQQNEVVFREQQFWQILTSATVEHKTNTLTKNSLGSGSTWTLHSQTNHKNESSAPEFKHL